MTDDRFHWCTEDSLVDPAATETLWDDPEPWLPDRVRDPTELFLRVREGDDAVVVQIEDRDGGEGAWINAANPVDVEQ